MREVLRGEMRSLLGLLRNGFVLITHFGMQHLPYLDSRRISIWFRTFSEVSKILHRSFIGFAPRCSCIGVVWKKEN